MAEINAFLAYSYSEEDKPLVEIFIEYLNTLRVSIPGFTWDHAKWAEAGSVSKKVLERFEGKNVLIVICMPSEYAISPRAVFRFPFLTLANLNHPRVELKTSDWIIQEIGLALGRGMKVIALLEESVRELGGLFGDIERIRFSRRNPQASFTQLQQMLSTPPKETALRALAEAKPATSDRAVDQVEPAANWESNPDWDQSGYNHAAFRAIVLERDVKALAELDAAYRRTPLANDKVALCVWEARHEFLRMLASEKSDFDKIKKAADEYPTNSELLSFLAHGYKEFGQIELAARTFELAGASADSPDDQIRWLGSAAYNYADIGRWDRAREIAESLKRVAGTDPDRQSTTLENLLDLAALEKNEILSLAILEQIVEMHPSDSGRRFDLAYKHSEVGNSDMALHHYLAIPIFERKAATWNNLGVAYSNFHLPIKATSAYREAERENDPVSMCNLGTKLLRAGFGPEARAMADKAIAAEPHHKNLPEFLKRLNEPQARRIASSKKRSNRRDRRPTSIKSSESAS